MDIEDFSRRVRDIDWSNYRTAYRSALDIPEQLIKLAEINTKAAFDASHQLWCSLCHQHAYISSAAEPAYPFLIEILLAAENDLIVEILDILAGFTECSSPAHPDGAGDFQKRVRLLLINDVELFRALKEVESAESFAEFIVEELADRA